MNGLCNFLKYILTFSCIFAGQIALASDEAVLNELFSELLEADPEKARDIEADISRELSRSGSDAMDHLLERGHAAITAGDSLAATRHLTALLDHAPNFAEGYSSRATAYYMSGLYGAAMADIGKALTLEPRHIGAMTGLATILNEVGQPEEALSVLRQIEQLHPNMVDLAERIQSLEQRLQGSAL